MTAQQPALSTPETVGIDTRIAQEGTIQQRRTVRWRVGRAAPLADPGRHDAANARGERQVVFITGEAGIGKTTFIEMAIERLSRHGVGRVVRALHGAFRHR